MPGLTHVLVLTDGDDPAPEGTVDLRPALDQAPGTYEIARTKPDDPASSTSPAAPPAPPRARCTPTGP